MNSEPERPATRAQWDSIRRVTAWSGLLAIPALLVVIALVGSQFTGSGPSDDAVTVLLVGLFVPAVIAGLISGGRFLTLYAGYAERVDATAALSAEDAVAGGRAVNGVMGDGLWGSLIAGVAAGVVTASALSVVLGWAALIMWPLLALIGALAWFTGWAIGAVTSLMLSTATGLIIGVSRRPERGRKLPFILTALTLPVLLVAVALPGIGTRVNGAVDVWSGILFAAGIPIAGAEFVLGDVLFVVARIAVWMALILIASLIAIGTPALLQRSASGG